MRASSRQFGRFSPALVIALGYLMALALTTKTNVTGANDSSRFATIESLVEHRTLAIDKSLFANSFDRFEFNGRFYSNKPPVLAIFGAGWYWLISRGLGVTFASDEKLCRYGETIFDTSASPKTVF